MIPPFKLFVTLYVIWLLACLLIYKQQISIAIQNSVKMLMFFYRVTQIHVIQNTLYFIFVFLTPQQYFYLWHIELILFPFNSSQQTRHIMTSQVLLGDPFLRSRKNWTTVLHAICGPLDQPLRGRFDFSKRKFYLLANLGFWFRVLIWWI